MDYLTFDADDLDFKINDIGSSDLDLFELNEVYSFNELKQLISDTSEKINGYADAYANEDKASIVFYMSDNEDSAEGDYVGSIEISPVVSESILKRVSKKLVGDEWID